MHMRVKTESSREKDHMVDPDVDENIILNLNLENKSVGLI
jgi:hypothetical protein